MKSKTDINLAIGVGRRKTSVARVYLRKGKGDIRINGKKAKDYFTVLSHFKQINDPLTVLGAEGKFNVVIRVVGGGVSGQAGACRHGLSRALAEFDVTGSRPVLKANGFLRRDSRMVERKKYGQPGARRQFQFSKR